MKGKEFRNKGADYKHRPIGCLYGWKKIRYIVWGRWQMWIGAKYGISSTHHGSWVLEWLYFGIDPQTLGKLHDLLSDPAVLQWMSRQKCVICIFWHFRNNCLTNIWDLPAKADCQLLHL